MTEVQQIDVGPDEADQRLDRWLRRRWPELSQGRIEKMCRKGELRVDGARAKASTRIGPGQTVRVPPITVRQKVDALPSFNAPVLPDGLILHRDEHLIVLNKPHGLAVQGGSGLKQHLGQMLPALRFGAEHDPRLVHRLDKDTSGVLVLARNGRVATDLAEQFRRRRVTKTYIAVVAGKPEPAAGVIRYGLRKAGSQGDEKMHPVMPDDVAHTQGAQAATTEYMVLEQLGARLAVVGLRPVTGRTHQLRAHMAALGCPVAGDGKYASRSAENLGDGWGAGLGAGMSRNLHLHAAALRFRHPGSGRDAIWRASLPDHMAQTWDLMGLAPVPEEDDIFELGDQD